MLYEPGKLKYISDNKLNHWIIDIAILIDLIKFIKGC